MQTQFTIKDKFKMPEARRGCGPAPRYPLRDLSIGQTLIVDFRSKRGLTRIRSAVASTSTHHGMRFMTRTLTPMPSGKLAVQRIRGKAN